MMGAIASLVSGQDEKTNILILKCENCGWSLRTPQNCLKITEKELRCGRCFAKIELNLDND